MKQLRTKHESGQEKMPQIVENVSASVENVQLSRGLMIPLSTLYRLQFMQGEFVLVFSSVVICH